MKGSYPEYEDKMKKCVESLQHELSTIRAGRASANVLDKVMVDYYGAATPLSQIASITSPEPRVLLVSPWDGAALKPAEKAILKSDIGITPISDGKALRLNFPPLTEERRRDLGKTVKKYSEESKIVLRNVRRDALEKAKVQKKKSEITEDDLKIIDKDMNELVDKYTKEIDKVASAKEKEIMEV